MSDKKILLNLSNEFHNKQNLSGSKAAFGNSFYPREVTIQELVSHIRGGKAFTMCAFIHNIRRKDEFDRGWLLGLDLDEGTHSIQDLLEHSFIKQYAFLLYPTPSSTPEHPKSRVLFVLDEPVWSVQDWERLQGALLVHFEKLKPDPACKDAARLFYGSDLPGGAVNAEKVLPRDAINKLAKWQRTTVTANGDGHHPTVQQDGLTFIDLPADHDEVEFASRMTSKALPQRFVEDVEARLGIQGYKENGWSLPIRCPFKAHEHDDAAPATHWHETSKCLKCFKCGQTWNAKDTGAQLGIKLEDYLEKKPDDHGAYEHKPDDDELSMQVREVMGEDWAYFRSSWHQYQDGVWQTRKTIFRQVRQVLRSNRHRRVKVTTGRVEAVERMTMYDMELEDDDIVDDYPQYINLKNGLYNLDTHELEPHRRDVYVTCQADFAYDPDAICPVFTDWLLNMLITTDGETDLKLYGLLQEAMGYTLTADTSHRASFWLWGPSGSGKSTLLKVLRGLMEMYHEPLDLNQVGTNRFLLARVAGKRLVTFGEADANTRLADGIYKTLVDNAGDIVADVKNKEPIVFRPQCKVWWGMNNLPYVADRSGAVDSRVIILPMRNQVPKDQWDFELDRKLSEEHTGIFNFAIDGLKRLRQQGQFTTVPQIVEIMDDFKQYSDIYTAFLNDDEWCNREGQTPIKDLYQAIQAWSAENGIRFTATQPRIKREWERLGLEYCRTATSRFWAGVELTSYARRQIGKSY